MNIRVNFGGNNSEHGINVVSPFSIPAGENLVDYVKPNVVGEYDKIKAKTAMFGIFVAISAVVMILSIVLLIVTGETIISPGWEDFYNTMGTAPTDLIPNTAWVPGIVIGAIGLVIFIIITSILGAKQSKLKTLRTAILEIKGRDKVSIDSLSMNRMGIFNVSKSTVIIVLRKLIETGNLEDYEIIGEVGIAKTSVRAKPSDFAHGKNAVPVKEEINTKQRRSTCPGCGAGIGRSKGRYCDFCGSLLD